MNPDWMPKTRRVWVLYGSKSPVDEVGLSGHFQASWTSRPMGCLLDDISVCCEVSGARMWVALTDICTCGAYLNRVKHHSIHVKPSHTIQEVVFGTCRHLTTGINKNTIYFIISTKKLYDFYVTGQILLDDKNQATISHNLLFVCHWLYCTDSPK